ncbi:IclR family transcriptional regulator [Pseudonocardia kujensis]|uniref:IclR family transcriptional regulator n=1 Tax=Pseudonocardia kujensis TaxID=1128675 RepID=UPI001E30420E|nr:IclR family transcriptional regulator [Pseudonocardia kujensis]
MTATEKPAGSVRPLSSALSTLRVLEEVAARQPIGVSELARVTAMPKSSVQRCLVTLQQAGWLRIVDPDRTRWGVTMKALTIGLRGTGEQDLRDLARPVVKRLAAETDETVHFSLRDGDDIVVIAREDSTHAVRVFIEVGSRVPLRASSTGLAILAGLAAEEVDEVLRHPVDSFPEPVPTARELRAEIARTAERGYALNGSSWFRPHVTSLGAAVRNAAGRPFAGLTLAIPEMRFAPSDEEHLARLTVAAAEEISELISSA